MGWIILSVIFFVAIGCCIVWRMVTTDSDAKIVAVAGIVGLAIVWLAISFFISIHNIGQRQVGIVYSFSGAIDGKKDTGTVLLWPWQHLRTANVGVLREDFTLDESNAAVSLDQQPIFANLALNYQVEPKQIVQLYKTVGPSWKQILLDARVLQDFKEVTAQYTAAQITTKRPQLRQDTKIRLAAELGKYDIRVVDFFVSNLGYTQSYKDAINAKNVQVQQALQAQAKVAQSKAEADQAVALAKGEAESIRLKGEAIRKNPSILQLEAIDKLNPNATVVICTGSGSGNCPSFLPQNLTTNSK